MKRFESKTVLISGGLGGMGMAIAKRLISEGANVVLGDLATPQAEEFSVYFGDLPHPQVVQLDVTNEASW